MTTNTQPLPSLLITVGATPAVVLPYLNRIVGDIAKMTGRRAAL